MHKKMRLNLLKSPASGVEARSQYYVLGLWVAAVGVVAALGVAPLPFGNPIVVALLALVAAIAERGRVEIKADVSHSISLVPTLFAAVLCGPLAAVAVAAASFVFECRAPYLRWASYTATRMLTAAATGMLAVVVNGAMPSRLGAVATAAVLGAVLSQSLDTAFAAVAFRLRRGAPMSGTFRDVLPLALAAVPLYAPVVAFLAFAFEQISPFTLPLFLVPALAAQRLFALYQAERTLTGELVDVNATLERANLSFASALVATLDARDRYTAGHSSAVAVYARDIAEKLALSVDQQRLAYVCGLVHDIGKIGLSAGVLEKPGALTLDERREMQRHSEIGERILANVDTYAEIATIVRHHHERVDGEGYPDGLRSDEIPLLSQIIAVADAYNAMTSDRPYRDAMPSRVARLRLAQATDGQFDTSIVVAFEAILATADENYRTARGPAFETLVQHHDAERPAQDARYALAIAAG
jgi:putative nucleotidyltransferase with HDIG domain